MHIPDVPQILLPPRLRANAFFPRMDQLENARHYWTGEGRRSFRKAADELIQKLLRRYLEMKWVSTRLHEGVEQRQSEDGDMWIPIVRQSGDKHGCIPRAVEYKLPVHILKDS